MPVAPDDEFARAHAQAVNAKLVEKVRALEDSEGRFEAMATASPVGMAQLDGDGNASFVNPRLAEITGRPATDLAGRGWLLCLESRVRREALEVVHGSHGDAVEHRYRTHLVRADRSERWLRVHVRPFFDAGSEQRSAVVMVDDVSDVVAAEERVIREARMRAEDAQRSGADRLDSLRRMAGGIAHDFNNLLGTMVGFLQLTSESIIEEQVAGRLPAATANAQLDDLRQVRRAAERAVKLTEQLLAFGGREINEPVTVDLKGYLAAFARGIAEDGIAVELRLADDTPVVRIDRRGLDRLLQILLRNATEAMPAGGTIMIGTSTENRGASITFSDTGTGMPPDVRRRAFEPFFSTKPGSRTAGLGLATALGIVSRAGGHISLPVPSVDGTAVRIDFPAVAPPAPSGRRPDTEAATTGRPEEHGKTVLLVHDDDDLRRAAERLIAKAGYRVLSASDGPQALAIAERHCGPVHCLVTDVMPEMDGRELSRRLLAIRPDTKVVFISGFAEALIDDQGRPLEPGRTIVAKPFSGARLRDALARVLASAGTGDLR